MKQEKYQKELLIEFNELKKKLDSLNTNLNTYGYCEKVPIFTGAGSAL